MSERINGWDERDAKLWSAINTLPSYGLVGGDYQNPMLSRKEVIRLLESAALERYGKARMGRTNNE